MLPAVIKQSYLHGGHSCHSGFDVLILLSSNDTSLLFCSIKDSIKLESCVLNNDTGSDASRLDTIRSESKKLLPRNRK
jgi:hypothetical protein